MGSRIENGIHILRTKMKVKGKEMIQDLNLQNRKKRREEADDKVLNKLDYDHRKPSNKEKGHFVL